MILITSGLLAFVAFLQAFQMYSQILEEQAEYNNLNCEHF